MPLPHDESEDDETELARLQVEYLGLRAKLDSYESTDQFDRTEAELAVRAAEVKNRIGILVLRLIYRH
jgi:hypothetical protein